MAELKTREDRELLEDLLLAAKNPDKLEANVVFAQSYHEILRRMRTDEPPKTEETTFGKLKKGDEFYTPGGQRHLVFRDPRYLPIPELYAVQLDGKGESIHELWLPVSEYEVRKIIK